VDRVLKLAIHNSGYSISETALAYPKPPPSTASTPPPPPSSPKGTSAPRHSNSLNSSYPCKPHSRHHQHRNPTYIFPINSPSPSITRCNSAGLHDVNLPARRCVEIVRI
jgi:hypothetical protein